VLPEAFCHKHFDWPSPYTHVLSVNLPLWFLISLLAVHTHTTSGRTLYFIKQFMWKLFLHFSPLVAGRSHVPMKRTGKGSACSSLLGVQELVTVQAAATQSIIQLPDFYCLVIINYTNVFIHNKHCKQYDLLLVLFKYTLQAICTISTYAVFAKFTFLR